MSKELKTSEQWYKKLGKKYLILDHDGWDRKNFEYSYKVEKIDEDEYTKRLFASTILHESQFGTFSPQ